MKYIRRKFFRNVFSQYIDFGAHFGGAFQGILWGMILLSYELDNERNRLALRVTSVIVFLATFIWAVYELAVTWDPVDTSSQWYYCLLS